MYREVHTGCDALQTVQESLAGRSCLSSPVGQAVPGVVELRRIDRASKNESRF